LLEVHHGRESPKLNLVFKWLQPGLGLTPKMPSHRLARL
jgi:hypothetical protein